jgi:5'-nucleotidase
VTNDDGVTAEGLTTLRARLLELGLRVSVVAPDGNRSGMARAISFDRPVAVVPAGGTADAAVFACTGSPVDCVRVGLLSGLLDPVDLVVAGINHGLNVGDDTTYSGTVGAALEAALLGVPAVAVSQQGEDGGFRFNDSVVTISFRLAGQAALLARAVADGPPPPRTVLNVNLPHRDGTPRIALTRPGRRFFTADVVKATSGPGEERAYYPYGLPADPAPRFDDGEGTDFAALQAGCISVSLLAAGAADDASPARRAWFHTTFAEPSSTAAADASTSGAR